MESDNEEITDVLYSSKMSLKNQNASDSGFASEFTDDLTSISSDDYEHRYGRRRFDSSPLNCTNVSRYHGMIGNPYPFPNDEVEKERLDQLQYCIRTLIGGNIVGPILKKPTQIS